MVFQTGDKSTYWSAACSGEHYIAPCYWHFVREIHWWLARISPHKGFPCHDVDGLVQVCSIPTANTLEILQSCTKPSMSCEKEWPVAARAQFLHQVWLLIKNFITVIWGFCQYNMGTFLPYVIIGHWDAWLQHQKCNSKTFLWLIFWSI